ncbi:uncharacterized protein LOC125745516 isoform X2 [Brienomyrus brachyistius]|uniref:uncharacterized protein LOC125745516 isoform X2 n=1 Tax=Brienomyrus brachyistius TaxID=42636 RepID=UPI0020B3874C|nr:uncharacterized protein LOC125745516 isoform X2 [Brienomyrus brachyistius]
MMNRLCLMLIFQGSLQLQCDRDEVNGIIGGVLVVICQYQTSRFLFSKKYWCLGESRSTCEILMDTNGYVRAELNNRFKIQEANRRGLLIQMADLQISDTGVYWVGIDKIYSDIMYRINIRVTEGMRSVSFFTQTSKLHTYQSPALSLFIMKFGHVEGEICFSVAVSEPRVWSLSPPEMSCWGKPLTLHCASDRGTRIKYGWFRATGSHPVSMQDSSNLQLQCGFLTEDGRYFCTASNSLGNRNSQDVTVQLLRPAKVDCIYILGIRGDNPYDCSERLRTTTAAPLEPTDTTDGDKSSLTTSGLNVTRTDRELPLWYLILRWLLFAALLTAPCLVPWLFQVLNRPTPARTPISVLPRSRKHTDVY